jgi:hypothetical protein
MQIRAYDGGAFTCLEYGIRRRVHACDDCSERVPSRSLRPERLTNTADRFDADRAFADLKRLAALGTLRIPATNGIIRLGGIREGHNPQKPPLRCRVLAKSIGRFKAPSRFDSTPDDWE